VLGHQEVAAEVQLWPLFLAEEGLWALQVEGGATFMVFWSIEVLN